MKFKGDKKNIITLAGAVAIIIFIFIIVPSNPKKEGTPKEETKTNEIVTPKPAKDQNPLTSEEYKTELSDTEVFARRLEMQMEEIRANQRSLINRIEQLEKATDELKDYTKRFKTMKKKEKAIPKQQPVKKPLQPTEKSKNKKTDLSLKPTIDLTKFKPTAPQLLTPAKSSGKPVEIQPIKIEKFDLTRGKEEKKKKTYYVIPPYSEANGVLLSGIDASVDEREPRPVIVKITSPWKLSNGQQIDLTGMRLLCKAVAMGSEKRIKMQIVGIAHVINEDNPVPFDNESTFKRDQQQGIGYIEDGIDGKFGVAGILHSKIPEKSIFTGLSSLIQALGAGFKAYNTDTYSTALGTIRSPSGSPAEYAAGHAAEAIGNEIAKDLAERRNLFKSYVSVEKNHPVKVYLMRRLEFDAEKYHLENNNSSFLY